MSIEYDQYIREHVENVVKAYDWLIEHFPDLKPEPGEFSRHDITNHDYSKWSFEEYDAYDKYFYGRNRSYAVVEDFNRAWLHHIHNNPHHWQHWVLLQDDSIAVKCIEMPKFYVVEMVADWWSFSWKTCDLYSLFDWYEKHDNMKFHPDTRKLVEDILDRIRNELDKERKDNA